MRGVVAVVIAATFVSGCPSRARTLKVGHQAELTLPRLGGGELSLESLKGKVVLVDVWASWCRPCVDSLPYYEDLQNALKSRGFAFVGVSVDSDERAAREFLSANGIALESLHDPGGRVVEEKLGVRALPTAYFIDRAGRIQFVHEGFTLAERESFRRRIEAMLE